MTDYNDSGQESTDPEPTTDERRAEWERFSMTVCADEGGGYVNVRNDSYDDGDHIYSVHVEDGEADGCSCPHAVYRDAHCKHQHAVEQRPLVLSSASATASAQTHRVATDGGTQQVPESNAGERAEDDPDGADADDDGDEEHRPQTDHWGNAVEHYDDEGVCGAGESRQCQACGSRFEVGLIAATADTSSQRWEEFYECQNCGATGSFRFDEAREDAPPRRTWTGMVAYPENV